MEIIGREQEKRALRTYQESKKPEFLVVYGRRRTGKTFLIKEFFGNDFCFYCTGRTEETMQAQLGAFNESLTRYGNDAKYGDNANWFDAFLQLRNLIESYGKTGKKIIFIDEMPWLDTPRSGFLSAFEYFWNSFASARPDILLIACGSATSWIVKKLFENTDGLFNRVTRRMYLKPFSLGECEQFYQNTGVVMNRYQMIESYMIFGGIPFYLDLFDKGYGFAQNVDFLCFGDSALLRNEYKSLYATLFKNEEHHVAIVGALAKKAMGMTREELLLTTKLSNGGRFSETLDDLELCGFIRKYNAFSKKEKGAIFQLTDPFTLFYHRFMKSRSQNTSNFWVGGLNSGTHNAWSGYAFEQVCLAHDIQIKQALGIAGVTSDIASWRGSTDGKNAQIDLIIDRADQVINLCEMKYSLREFEITKAYSESLEAKIHAFAGENKKKKALHTTFVTTYGVKRNKYISLVQSEVTMNDLFRY
ncbi:MAG: ATP-binding protein [Clostridiales Family XIII bacterium]|jgi:AAA+ ATPase superfamily predicted ATPase|nr:ATP-binding protein [Clostridiales Family XIII bacterium]